MLSLNQPKQIRRRHANGAKSARHYAIVVSKYAGLICLYLSVLLAAVQAADSLPQLYDRPVLHRAIPLYDEDNHHVKDSGKPYSPRNSCGEGAGSGCHDYQAITHAYHFEMGRDESDDDYGAERGTNLGKKLCDDGKLPAKLCKKGAALPHFAGLPQLTSPGYFGGYTCMGGNNPLWLAKKANDKPDWFADYGAPGLVQQCAACHPGGGWAEKDRDGQRYDAADIAKVPVLDGDYYNRGSDLHNEAADAATVSLWDWRKSGVVEADCMLCHIDFQAMRKFPGSGLGLNDGSDGSSDALAHWRVLRNTKLIKAGFFRYADSSIFEFINLKPEEPNAPPLLTVKRQPAKSEPPSLDPYSHTALPNYTLVLDGAGQPQLQWNKAVFDELDKVSIPMLRFPQSEACMQCHYTSEARRGFYGFGPEAKGEPVDPNNPKSPLKDDFRDDVHKGTLWTEPNGEQRGIENCNGCHARAYYKPASENVALNLDHNFLKGNADNDVRNDLDFGPGTKSCEWCHRDAPNPIIPSKQPTLLDAHREVWSSKGFMAGYQQEELTKITKTHFDVVECQSCHIKGLQADGKPLHILYRYRVTEDGTQKVVPYNPAIRYYWQDKSSGYVLSQWERNSIFQGRTEGDGNPYGAVMDPSTQAELAQIPASLDASGHYTFQEPQTEQAYRAIKQAYDHLLQGKGYVKPDTTLVWNESNEYLITHNTRPATGAVPCEDCHQRTQRGSISSAISPDGILGAGNVRQITALPSKKLVDDGVVTLGLPYMKVDDVGRVTESVPDVLYVTKMDGFMSALRNSSSRTVAGFFRPASWEETMSSLRATADTSQAISSAVGMGNMLLFNARVGDLAVKNSAVILRSTNDDLVGLLSQYQLELVAHGLTAADMKRIPKKKLGVAVGVPAAAREARLYYSLGLRDSRNKEISTFPGATALVQLPYFGRMSDLRNVHVIAADNSGKWRMLPAEDMLAMKPYDRNGDGVVLFKTEKTLSRFLITDKRVRRKKS